MSATGRGREREPDDFYSTPSWCIRRLLEEWEPPKYGHLVEPSAGNGAIIRAAAPMGIEPWRWFAHEIREEERETLSGLCTAVIGDFLTADVGEFGDEAVTAVLGNPPFSRAWDFIKESSRKYPGAEICFLLRLAFAASEERNAFMRDSTPDVYVLPNRPSFTGEGSDSADYAWFVWHPETRATGKFVVLNATPLAAKAGLRACGDDRVTTEGAVRVNLELFPCSGGMAEGFRRAGITFDLAIDHDADACDSYGRNLGHRPVQMDVNDFHRMVTAGWRPPGGVELLVADPPCTPWSRAGKREGLKDERDCLVVTADLIRLLRPSAYLIGNVPGLQDSTQWNVVQRVIGGLRDIGYCVRDYVSLDAADYGVPQHRVRPFWFGHLDGPCVAWPVPTHGRPTEQIAIGGHELTPWVTCRQALGHLTIDDLGRPVKMRIREKGEDGTKHGGDVTRCSSPDEAMSTAVEHPRHPVSSLDKPSRIIKTGGGRASGNGSTLRLSELTRDPNDTRKANYSSPDSPALTITRNTHSEGATLLVDAQPMRGARIGGPDRPSDVVTSDPARVGAGPGQVLEWPWNRPATTVSATDERLPKVGHHGSGSGSSTQHGPNAIVLSEKAAAILQGFPDGWLFSGDTKRARWGQIGMAMPPPLAHAVAASVAEQMRAASAEAA